MWWGTPAPQSAYCADCDVEWRDIKERCWMCDKAGEAKVSIDPQFVM